MGPSAQPRACFLALGGLGGLAACGAFAAFFVALRAGVAAAAWGTARFAGAWFAFGAGAASLTGASPSSALPAQSAAGAGASAGALSAASARFFTRLGSAS